MMALFLYRCPNTGLRVQGCVEDANTDVNETREIYRGEDCPACKVSTAAMQSGNDIEAHAGADYDSGGLRF
jgi:hypothetical protein